MKTALIIPNNLCYCPYLFIYTRLLDAENVSYDIISWDREGKEEDGIQFRHHLKSRNRFAVLWSYIRFSFFSKRTITKNHYDRLIVFTSQLGIFLSSFLSKYYKRRYIFDYRDLSIEQNDIFSKRFDAVLSNSFANVISSPGFKKYLPAGFDYVISHNFNVTSLKESLAERPEPSKADDIMVLTIGALRKDMNVEVIDALGNVPGFSLSFVGKGGASDRLEKYSKENGYKNIVFTGYYKKEEEPVIYRNHTFVNIIYPLIPSHITAISNRFYNSLIYKRPMVVMNGTIQGEYAKQYEVGLVIDSCDKLNEKIIDYHNGLDFDNYVDNCNRLLRVLLDDNMRFENVIKRFADY